MNFTTKLRAVLAELNTHHGGASFGNPRTIPKTLADFPLNASATGQVFSWGGMKLGLSTASHAAAALQIAFDELPPVGDDSLWYNLGVNGSVRRPDGLPFKRFFARLQPGVAQSSLRKAILVIDPDPASGSGDTVQEGPRLGNVTLTGKTQVECGFLTLAGADVSGIASDEGAVAVSGWDGVAYRRMTVAANGGAVGNFLAVAGLDSANNVVRALPAAVGGQALTGTGVVVPVGGSDGALARPILTDTSGRTISVGAAAAGAATSGNPVLVGGSDGANARTILTDASGRTISVGAAAAGAVLVGNPVLAAFQNITGSVAVPHLGVLGSSYTGTPNIVMTGGRDGSNNAQLFLVDTSGRSVIVGAAADAAATAGNPLLIAGTFSSNVKTLIVVASNSTTTIDGTAANSRLAVHNQASTTVGTLWSASVVGINGTSTAFPIYGHRRVEIFGNTSAATTLTVQFSLDSATWFDATSGTAAGQTPSVAANGNFSLSFDTGAPYCRLKSSAAATITALAGAKA